MAGDPPSFCFGPGALVPTEDRSAPYVGRPVMLSDMCVLADQAGRPEASYLWFDAAVGPGTVDLGDGFVQETVEVDGTRLTVGSTDAALREQILASATGGETCMADLEVQQSGFPAVVPGDAERDGRVLNVCVYHSPGDPRPDFERAELDYATTLGREALQAYLAALAQGDRPRDQCPTIDYAEGEWVVLEIGTEDGEVLRRDVVHTFCPGIAVGADRLGGLETVRLTPEMVEPWAVEGIKAVVHGPSSMRSQAFGDYFIGPQG
ncbi:hypothetical protein LRP67_10115 [Nocardioides sp. cx-169]|uniref:hypothetical protein n=1 Tax=Nocardioides sp. cx-169 TaxID=2899080 RepID=UPI001E3514E7|nr:hypothetical protein [Nocardioides sp. cx-169]MCD4534437.1 hypothetical protein [Nocardioides sp. cx-169]